MYRQPVGHPAGVSCPLSVDSNAVAAASEMSAACSALTGCLARTQRTMQCPQLPQGRSFTRTRCISA